MQFFSRGLNFFCLLHFASTFTLDSFHMTSDTRTVHPPAPNFPKGTLVWFRDEALVWRSGTVLRSTETDYVLETRLGEDNVTLSKTHEIIPRNKDEFGSEGLVVLDDLTQLTHLNEPAVLHSLQIRFDTDKIYTFTGPILIAVNPFKRIPELYNDTTLESYTHIQNMSRPHVFATANAAFRGICDHQKSQTVLISGESGAGKTESTKHVMKFLAVAGAGGTFSSGQQTGVEQQVLASNPLLEAFGNARTLRNDNSSRFGKFIELQFNGSRGAIAALASGDGLSELNNLRLCGARIQTYLLEKIRVTDQQEGERNFHIFYQCCAAAAALGGSTYSFPRLIKCADPFELDMSGFSDHANFHYLVRSSVVSLDEVDDCEEFEQTIAAMRKVGVSVQDINTVLNCVAATLLLGNVGFVASGEGCRVENSPIFEKVCGLLGIADPAALEQALTTKTISTKAETYVSPISVAQSRDFRDALARQLYGLLFLRLVDKANESIGYLNNLSLFVGVLDIFGFECFKTNSFEQLCINFTNERLQQFFNNFVFKLEEALYKKEEIPWDPLDFPDNQDSVDLIAESKMGIFAMLDEECVVPGGTDKGFCNKLIAKYQNTRRFDVIKTKSDWFVVRHFAGPVSYASEGFLEKNRDQLSVPIYSVMKASSNSFVASMFVSQQERRDFTASDGRKKKLLTLSNEFKDQLQLLMDTVTQTEPHFIRCIKPNPQNLPDVYDRPSVTEQLRYGGVLQAVQVSRAGYPVRINHADMWLEYRCVLRHKSTRDALAKLPSPQIRALQMMQHLETELKIPRHLVTNSISWAVGKTLVFMKHEAYERLQSARLVLRNESATKLQARYRAYVQQKIYLFTLVCVRKMQALIRGKLVRLKVARIRKESAAIVVQSVIRMALVRFEYLRKRAAAIRIQSRRRGIIVRRKFATIKVDRAALRIQAAWRSLQVRRTYRVLVAGIVQAQHSWRMRSAKLQLRRLKQEAKEVGSLLGKYQSVQVDVLELKKRNADLEGSKIHYANEKAQLLKKIDLLCEEIQIFKNEEIALKASLVAALNRPPVEVLVPRDACTGPPIVPPLPIPELATTYPSPMPMAVMPAAPAAVAGVSAALDSFKNWLGVKGSTSKQFSGGVLQSSLKGTKSMKAACKDPEALSDLRPVQELQDGESAVTCICFGQEKAHRAYILLAAASKDGTVVIYRCYRTEMERLALNEADFPKSDEDSSIHPSEHGNIVVHCRLTGHTRAITSLFFSLLEDMLVTTSIDKSVRFWSADSGEMLKVFTDSSPVPVACFLPFNPSVFVAANSNAVLRLVNATNGMVLQKLKVEAEVRALKFDDTGLFLLAGTKNGSIHVLEACDNATLRFKFKLQLARGGITCITFVSASQNQPPCLLVNSSDSSVTIVDCVYGPPGSVLINLNVRHRVKVAHSLLPLKCCYSSSDQGYLVSGSEDKGVYVFSLGKNSNYKMQVLNHHQVPVVAVSTNLQDTLLASADSLGRIVLWRRLDFSHIWQPTTQIESV